MAKLCSNCKCQEALKKCSSCKKVYYCSIDCQIIHWNIHRSYCKHIIIQACLVNGDQVIEHDITVHNHQIQIGLNVSFPI